MTEILTTYEAAQMLRVSQDHLRSLCKAGKIHSYKEGRRGGFRIPRESVEEYISNKLTAFRDSNK